MTNIVKRVTLYLTNKRKGVVDMFDQLRNLISYIMNYGQNAGNIDFAFKLAIGAMILYAGVHFFLKRKSKHQGHVNNTATPQPKQTEPVQQSQPQQVREDKALVDRKLVQNLKYRVILDDELRGEVTETGHDVQYVYELLSDFIKNAPKIVDDLKRNEEKYNQGASHASGLFEVSMDNYEVEVNLGIGYIYISFGKLQTLTSIDDLRGYVDDGIILSDKAFYTSPSY